MAARGHNQICAPWRRAILTLSRNQMKSLKAIALLAISLGLPSALFAAQIGSEKAAAAVTSWLQMDRAPFGEPLGNKVKNVETFKDNFGNVLYHVVYLDPSGFVIVSGDDLVEPIIAFVSRGRFDPSSNNPLGAIVSADVPARVACARALQTTAPGERFLKARGKWRALQPLSDGDTNSAPPSTLSAVSDMRIAPFVQTLWNQGTANNGMACYNYYTPPYAAGSTSNWPCGCVATCLAQLLGYFQYPKAGVGTNSFPISVDGTNETARLRGGDGTGGPYAWSNMPANPVNPTVAQCQAIGALMYDCGVSEQMGYGPGGSGAGVNQPQVALVGTYMYSNAVFGAPANDSLFDPPLVTMVNANLDARLPVGVALNGHEVVSDGYGYNLSTLYNHINMGWGGGDNAWYALPIVDTFTNLWGFIYNIYPNGSGEIISGRITAGNAPVSNATVTASRSGGGSYTATTDTNGIYAFVAIPSGSQYTVTVNVTNFAAAFTNCSTGRSINGGTNSGNVWGVDFSLVPGSGPPVITAQPQNQLFVDLGGAATFSVSALGNAPISYQWRFNGTNLPGAIAASLTITNVQLPNTGNYCVVVTDPSGSVTSVLATLSIALPPTIGNTTPSQPGFIARCSQIDYAGADQGLNNGAVMNSIASMEAAFGPVSTNNTDGAGLPSAGLFIDPLTGLYCVNVANLLGADANGFFFVPGYINMDIDGATAQDGDFTSSNGVSGWPKSPFPGIPGFSQLYPGTTEFAVAFTAYVYLQAGVTEFGVDSDDGFLLTLSSEANPNDAFSRTNIGQFNGVRGWSDTLMEVTVPTNGFYALRLDYEQGTGGANCELFTVVDGVKILVNDTNNPNCLLAYPAPEVYAEPYAVVVSPAPGQTQVALGSQILVMLQDGVPATVNTNSIVLKLNGVVVSPAISQSPSALPNGKPIGNLTTIAYNCATSLPFPLGNTLELVFADSKGNLTTHAWSFTNEPALSAGNANPAANASATNPGFIVYPWHTSVGEPNDVAVWTEEQILGLMGPNIAILSAWPNSQNGQTENATPGPQGPFFVYTNYINWDIQGPTDGWGDFTSWDGVTGYPKQEFPGIISGSYPDDSNFPTTDCNNFSMLVETWLDFPAAGTWQMGVNSDDGFSVKSGQAPGDVFGQTLGEFEGGRSATDTTFSLFIPQPGLYPFRLLYEQGGGSANCEWFTITPAGQRVLINDSSQGTNAIYSYVSADNSPIYVSGVIPVNGAAAVGANSDITAFLVDGNPAQVASVQMWVNGSPATVSATRSNNVTTATAVNTGTPLLLLPGTNNTVTIVYTDNASPPRGYTNSWQFAVAAASSLGGYLTLNPLNANPTVEVSATNSGFIVYPWHTSASQPNDVAVWTDEQILGLMGTNYATLTNWPNSQNGQTENAVSGPQGWYFIYTNYINWDLYGPTDQWGDFNSPTYPKQEFPGIIFGSYPDESGSPTTDGNNFSMLVETWLDFPAAGTWQMGVNSDDSFSVKSGQAPGDIFGQLLGEGGWSTFSFLVPQPGVYPFRLLYEQGGWAADCEWFTVTPAGQRVLINDSSQGTNAVYSYVAAGNSPIYVSGVIPVNGASGVGANTNITAFLVDGNPAQVASVQMWINGSSATVRTTRTNKVTTATAVNTAHPFLLLPGTNNTVTIVYTDNASPPHSYTNSWQFGVLPLLASQSGPVYYQSPGTLAVSCQVEYPSDQSMYFLVWQPALPLGWSVTAAAGDGNPQVSDSQIIFDGPFPNPMNFTYTVTIPPAQNGPQDIVGEALYFLSGMTNTAIAPAAPDPLVVGCANLYVYNNTNCAVCAPSGLVSWWPADLNADDVAGTNNGTLENGTTFAPGEVGGAFSFNGVNQYVSVPNSPAWGFGTNAFSIDLWANFSATGGSPAFLANDEGGGCTYKWIFWLNGSTLQLHVNTPTCDASYIGSASFTPTLGQWYHIALTRDGSTFLFYIDGLLVSSDTNSVVIPSPDAPLTIGQAEGGFNFCGLLDDIRIYNRALAFSEIEAIYRAGTNGMCAPAPLMFSGPPACGKTKDVVLNAALRSGQSYTLQATTNLASTNWISLTNFTAGSAPVFHFTNCAATNIPQQFYRIISP
ncbi:MAG: C10 family peptidase [Verrucomicrobiota bacterium]|jgi:hypothetical protein